jgi:hypothetical protein
MTTINEQVRRREFVRDMRAASAQGEELEEYRAKRDQVAAEWAAWFREAMDQHQAEDPVEVLPQALALLQERAIAAARTAARTAARDEVKAMLRRLRFFQVTRKVTFALSGFRSSHNRGLVVRQVVDNSLSDHRRDGAFLVKRADMDGTPKAQRQADHH